MIDLGLNQYKIKEIKYEVKEGKTVVFKLNNFNLEDVVIETNDSEECQKKYMEEPDYHPLSEQEDYKSIKKGTDAIENKEKTEEDKCEKFSLECLDKYGPKKQIDDYEPISCLRSEKGMQESLEASRRKKWKEDVIKNPSKGTPTGNALIKIDDNSDAPLKPNETKFVQKATIGEIRTFNAKQKLYDSKVDTEYRDKIEKKLAKDLIRSKTLIDEYLSKMSKSEKDAFANRIKEKYFSEEDNYDEFSKILFLNGCLNPPNLNEGEKKTLDASKKKEWEENVKGHEINPDNYKMVSLDEKYKDATNEEKMKVSGEIIKKMAEKDSETDKKRNADRAKDIYFSDDPNDEYSKIKSFKDIDTEKTKFIEFLKDKPKTLKERDEAGLKSIINIFKEGDKEENKE